LLVNADLGLHPLGCKYFTASDFAPSPPFSYVGQDGAKSASQARQRRTQNPYPRKSGFIPGFCLNPFVFAVFRELLFAFIRCPLRAHWRLPFAVQNDRRAQPFGCGSFPNRAAVQVTSGSVNELPGCTIVPWSRPVNIQYSSGWPAAQR